MLIDGHGLAFRAFYAIPLQYGVITGFMNMLERLEREQGEQAPSYRKTFEKKRELAPHGQFSLFDEKKEELSEGELAPFAPVAVVFDAPGKTFRHAAFPEYKQQRKPTPPEFKPQVPLLVELLKLLGYPVLMVEGVEADDVIASACGIIDNVVVSSDKDLLQILRPGVEIMRPVKGVGVFNRYDEKIFVEEYGFAPSSMPDYLALLGDTADNLPGVPGIGEKSALALISEYKTLENIFENIEKLKPAHKKSLGENRDRAMLSRELNTLKSDVPLDEKMFVGSTPDYKAAFALCEKLGLRQLCNRIMILTK